MSNWLSDEKRISVVRCLLSGLSVRQTAATTGCSKVTVSRYRSVIRAAHELYGESDMQMRACQCGKAAGHNGWCASRYDASPKRQRLIRKWTRTRTRSVAHQVDTEGASPQ